MSDEKIKRINALARKAKEQGLSEAEAQEQKKLRKEFLEEFRANFRKDMDKIEIVEKDGTVRTLKEVRNEKSGK
jgi:uncharacterized protein YnzC (UPF0291/DUF896 family)